MIECKNSKPLIIACGLSGSGKTFNSLHLEKNLKGYLRLNPEIVREEMDITTYSRKDTPRILAHIIDRIEELHNRNEGAIVDANLKSNDLRQSFYDLAKHLNEDVIVIEFICSMEECKKRMTERKPLNGKIHHPIDPKIFDTQKKTWQDIAPDLELKGNDHVLLMRYDSSSRKAEVVKTNDRHNEFIDKIILLLEQKEIDIPK